MGKATNGDSSSTLTRSLMFRFVLVVSTTMFAALAASWVFHIPLTLRVLLATVSIGVAGAIALGFLILGRWARTLSSRLHSLAGAVHEFRETRQFTQQVSGNLASSTQGYHDEISQLRQDIEQMMRSVEQSEKIFSKAFRSSPLAITISTEDGQYIDVNEAFVKMLGYEYEGTNYSATELQVWAVPEQRAAMIDSLKASGNVLPFETSFLTKSGEIKTVRIAAEPISVNNQPCVLAYSLDLTDARRLEDQLRQAQKLEAVGLLAGGVAHDFNNILSVIIGYSDLLQQLLNADSPERKHIDQIKKSAYRAAEVTRQLLAFGRREVTRPKVLDLSIVATNLNKMLSQMIREDITLEIVPGRELGRIRADLGQIEQVLMNLVVNARDAMPRGGAIVIETANSELDESYVQHHQPEVLPGRYVMLSVSDTGTGMDEDTQRRIFDPFFTTKAPGQGTGLGLATVYGIVKQSKGYIWVYSEPGRGSIFKMYFPRVDEPVEPLAHSKTEGVIAKGTETILLVEDDAALRELSINILKEHGYSVLDAKDAQAALAMSKHYWDVIHLLLTDVIMPGMSGSELAKRLSETRPGVKVLYMSGYAGDLISDHSARDTKATLLEKPFTRQALLSRVRSVLDFGQDGQA